MSDPLPLIKVVGVSAAGKSTLVAKLREAGYNARPASQEHSQVADMWRQIRPPDVLIYLHADLACQRQRRPDVYWSQERLDEEEARLVHARAHANLIVDTRRRSPDDVFQEVVHFLKKLQLPRADKPLPPLPPTGAPDTSANRRRSDEE
jgi:hypothetical protein